MTTISKRERTKLTIEQKDNCACCGEHIGMGKHFVYDKETNSLVCRSCYLWITSCRKAQERGYGFDVLVRYEERRQRLET